MRMLEYNEMMSILIFSQLSTVCAVAAKNLRSDEVKSVDKFYNNFMLTACNNGVVTAGC
jgi:hypothetical protein